MRIALVGFGKVGQALYRAAVRHPNLEFVAIADPRFGRGLQPPAGVHCYSEHRRTHLSWGSRNPDLVIDASGATANRAQANEHFASGVPRVLVTASLPGADATLIAGVNEATFDPFRHLVISASSCTAVAFSPLAKFLDHRFGIKWAKVLVMHGYDTANAESTVDSSRMTPEALAAVRAGQTAPYETNFVVNVASVLPQLATSLWAEGQYVPVNRVLLFQAEIELRARPSCDQLHREIAAAAYNELRGILHYQPEQVQTRTLFPDNEHSTIFLGYATNARRHNYTLFFGGDYIYGYAVRTMDLVSKIAGRVG